MQYKIFAVSTDNANVLDVINQALQAYRDQVSDEVSYVVISAPVAPRPCKGFEALIRETHRVAQIARSHVRSAEVGFGIAEGTAELLINKGARRVKLKTWPIMGVVEHGPISMALPQKFEPHLTEPIARAIESPYNNLQGPACEQVPQETIAASMVVVAAWAEMRFPEVPVIEEKLY